MTKKNNEQKPAKPAKEPKPPKKATPAKAKQTEEDSEAADERFSWRNMPGDTTEEKGRSIMGATQPIVERWMRDNL